MLPDRVSNPGPLTYESGALPHKEISDQGQRYPTPTPDMMYRNYKRIKSAEYLEQISHSTLLFQII